MESNGDLMHRIIQQFIQRYIPDRIYLRYLYRQRMGKSLNLDDPQTFNEKLQWLKLYDRKPVYTTMVDKYEAKKYVAGIIGEEYIIPTLGVWDKFDDIDFNQLPDRFVLKCTHDSGGFIICRNKSELNVRLAGEKISRSLARNYYFHSREWTYKNVRPRIIAEQYMEQEDGSNLTDYKFFCFDGQPLFLYVSRGLENYATAEISFYDMDGREAPFHRKDYKPYHNAEMPPNFDKMKLIAESLAQNAHSPFVRIDLYSVNGRVYFSEITFSPGSGMIPFDPDETDLKLGRMLKLPKKKKEKDNNY